MSLAHSSHRLPMTGPGSWLRPDAAGPRFFGDAVDGEQQVKGYRDPLLAGALALVPGAGQIYAGQPLRGLTFILSPV